MKSLILPDKGFLTVGKDGFIKLSDPDTLEVKKSFRISDMPCSDLAQLTKEVFVVSGWDSCLHIFNLNYGSTVSSIPAHDDAISCLKIIPSKVQFGLTRTSLQLRPGTAQ